MGMPECQICFYSYFMYWSMGSGQSGHQDLARAECRRQYCTFCFKLRGYMLVSDRKCGTFLDDVHTTESTVVVTGGKVQQDERTTSSLVRTLNMIKIWRQHVAGHKVLLEGGLYLKQRLRLPDAYITTMNVCQAYTLKWIRDPDYHGVTTCRQYDMVPKLGPRREQHCHIRCFDNIISDVIVTIYHSSVDISMYHVGIRFFRDVNNNSSVVYVYL